MMSDKRNEDVDDAQALAMPVLSPQTDGGRSLPRRGKRLSKSKNTKINITPLLERNFDVDDNGDMQRRSTLQPPAGESPPRVYRANAQGKKSHGGHVQDFDEGECTENDEVSTRQFFQPELIVHDQVLPRPRGRARARPPASCTATISSLRRKRTRSEEGLGGAYYFDNQYDDFYEDEYDYEPKRPRQRSRRDCYPYYHPGDYEYENDEVLDDDDYGYEEFDEDEDYIDDFDDYEVNDIDQVGVSKGGFDSSKNRDIFSRMQAPLRLKVSTPHASKAGHRNRHSVSPQSSPSEVSVSDKMKGKQVKNDSLETSRQKVLKAAEKLLPATERGDEVDPEYAELVDAALQ
jgi:hypothetical protein